MLLSNNKPPNLTNEEIIKSVKKSIYKLSDQLFLKLKLSWTNTNTIIPIVTITEIDSTQHECPDKEIFYSFYSTYHNIIHRLISDYNLEPNLHYNDDCLDKFINC